MAFFPRPRFDEYKQIPICFQAAPTSRVLVDTGTHTEHIRRWTRNGQPCPADTPHPVASGGGLATFEGFRYRYVRRVDVSPRGVVAVYVREKRGLKEQVVEVQGKWFGEDVTPEVVGWAAATGQDWWTEEVEDVEHPTEVHQLTHWIWELRSYVYIGIESRVMYGVREGTGMSVGLHLVISPTKTERTPTLVLGDRPYLPEFRTLGDGRVAGQVPFRLGYWGELPYVDREERAYEVLGDLTVAEQRHVTCPMFIEGASMMFFARRQMTETVTCRGKIVSHRELTILGAEDRMLSPPLPLSAMSTRADAEPVLVPRLEDERQRRGVLKREIAEAVFHPDRVARMEAVYGEDWFESQ